MLSTLIWRPFQLQAPFLDRAQGIIEADVDEHGVHFEGLLDLRAIVEDDGPLDFAVAVDAFQLVEGFDVDGFCFNSRRCPRGRGTDRGDG